MPLAKRKENLFDLRDIRDYNKPSTITSLRANCVRAVELDDKQGGKKNCSYLLAMKGLADAIYAELGVKLAKVKAPKEVEVVNVKDSEDYKSLEALLMSTQTRSVEQEEELVELDSTLEEKDKELESMNEDCTTMAAKIKDLEAQLTAKVKAPVKAKAKATTKKAAK